MAIPAAVRRKAEKARQLAAAQGQPQTVVTQQPAPQVSQTPAAPVATNPPAAPLDNGTVDAVSVETQVADPAMAPGKIPQDDYKTRFENLRTSRNADKQKAAQLEAENAQLKAQLATASQPEVKAPSPLELSEEERKDMSPEELKVYERIGSKLEDKFQSEAVDDAAQAELVFFADVESVIPNWAEINGNKDFVQWLAAIDGLSGRTRLELLTEARSKLDANTVINIFSAFANEAAQATVVDSGNQNTGLGNPSAVAATIEPGRGAAAANPLTAGAGQGRIWTASEVKQFYREKNQLIRRKRYAGDVKTQMDALDADIRKAHAEGRIR